MKYKQYLLQLLPIIFTIVFLLIWISSCKMPRYCYGYDLNNHRDIAFRKGDTIKYYADNNGIKDSLVFLVSDFYSTGPSEYYEYSIYPDYDCYYEAYYQTNEIESVSIREHFQYNNEMEVKIGNDLFSFSLCHFTHDTIMYESDYTIISSFVKDNGEKLYYWTINDSSGNRRFDSFTKMENKGIVEFHDKVTGKHWQLWQPDGTYDEHGRKKE